MSKKAETLLFLANGVFLDPANVGSSVRWNVSAVRNFRKDKPAYVNVETELSLSDCHRVINWGDYSGTGKDMLIKVSKAIAELTAFRAALQKAIKLQAKEPRDEDE